MKLLCRIFGHKDRVVPGSPGVWCTRCWTMPEGVTLGAVSTTRAELQRDDGGKRHPTIEDDVTIYSGATILGGNTVIGHGSVVGGNVWIVLSLPPFSKVFGGPRQEGEQAGGTRAT